MSTVGNNVPHSHRAPCAQQYTPLTPNAAAFAWNPCYPAIATFKRLVASQAKSLAAAGTWGPFVDYAVGATAVILDTDRFYCVGTAADYQVRARAAHWLV